MREELRQVRTKDRFSGPVLRILHHKIKIGHYENNFAGMNFLHKFMEGISGKELKEKGVVRLNQKELEDLRDRCEIVMKFNSLSKELLPNTISAKRSCRVNLLHTDYDEAYYRNVGALHSFLNEALNGTYFEDHHSSEFYYEVLN